MQKAKKNLEQREVRIEDKLQGVRPSKSYLTYTLNARVVIVFLVDVLASKKINK